jgi:preprotein translocase subunit SecE
MAKTNPAQYVREVLHEVSKVTWPSRKETGWATVTVFAMVVVIAVFFFGVDAIISKLVKLILGLGG